MKKTLWVITIVVFGLVIAALAYVKLEGPKFMAQYNQTAIAHKVIHEKLSLAELNKLLDLTEDDMRNKLGAPDRVTTSGPDSIYYGYVYGRLGITAIFGEESDKPLYLECSNRVSFHKVKSGMNFAQIQRRLGKSAVRERYEGTWELSYQFKGLYLTFLSNFKNGKGSKLQVSNESQQPI